MADTSATLDEATEQRLFRGLPDSSRGGRGGRGGGRGGRGHRGNRGGRGNASGQGRGGSSKIAMASSGSDPQQPTENQTSDSKQATAAPNADEHSDDKVCFICANPILYNSIAPCGHTTCHICSLRMRALYKNKNCPHCRTESDFVVFAEDDTKSYADFEKTEFVCEDENLGIKFETQKIYEDVRLLLQYNCPDPKCEVACLSWADLQRHVGSAHHRSLCNLCIQHKRVFAHEHQLFTRKDLNKHEQHGDDQPGAVNQSGFKGHPPCLFCNQRFYSSDELFVHCRENHERCFICDRNRPAGRESYFEDYHALENHFRKEHFMCPDERCIQERFVVFETEIDLKAHQLEKHPQGLSKSALRDARRIDMTNFQDAVRRHEEPRRGRGGRGRGGRDRDNAGPSRDQQQDEPVPNTNLRRDELAFQRSLAVQSASGSRAFGGQLTEPAFAAPRPSPQAPNVQTMQVRTSNNPAPPPTSAMVHFPPLAALRDGTVPGPSSVPPSEAPRKLTEEQIKARHISLIERAGNYLKNDRQKLDTFRTNVSDYKNSKITAKMLVEKFYHLFGISVKELGSLLKDLSELYEDEAKRKGLQKAWSEWKTTNEHYPPMASSSSAVPAPQTSRVLRVKSSTAASRGPWSVSNAMASSSRTPPISTSSSTTSLASRAAASSSRMQAARPTPPVTSKAEFPALPPKKPAHPPVNPKNRGIVVANAWSSGRNDDAGEGPSSAGSDEAGEANGNGKKKKGKKQTLMHFG